MLEHMKNHTYRRTMRILGNGNISSLYRSREFRGSAYLSQQFKFIRFDVEKSFYE